MEMDELDRLAADAFRGLIVRKELVRQFRGQFPVPTYVVEFMLGRYCATTDEKEIAEGLEVVRTQLSSRTVRAGEDELIKSRARETGAARVIDIITARLDAKSDSYLATLPSLRLTDVRLADETVRENERMLTGGFYAEIDLGYDATIAQEKGGRPFQANAVRPIQLSTRGILDRIIEGRAKMTTAQWKDFLLRSVGLEPERMSAAGAGYLAAADGPLRRAQLQHGRAGAARHRQEPSVPADLALFAPGVGRQGHGRADVRQHGERAARAGVPVRRGVFR